MGWWNVPTHDQDGRPCSSLEAALRLEFPSIVAVDADARRHTAFIAEQGEDGEVRPVFLMLDWFEVLGGKVLMYKDLGIEESPVRWPLAVVDEITRWSWEPEPAGTWPAG